MTPGRLALVALLTLAAPAPGWAHRESTGRAVPADAIAIPSLTHGQMGVIARHMPAIRALAEAQYPTDPTMRRLQGYVNLQSFACVWGVVPGSLTDEASPFNECAHAYLAGARALLVHLSQMPGGDRGAVRALVGRIEVEMLENGAALTLCRYSDEPFSTAEVVPPRWRDMPFHAPTVLSFAALACGLAGALAAVRFALARRRGNERRLVPFPS